MADNYNDELVYDLRVKYAEIVGLHLEEVTNTRVNSDYPGYFKALDNLFTVIKHKFKTKKDKEKDYSLSFHKKELKTINKKTDLELYEELRQKAINISNKHRSAFLGQTSNPDEISEIEKSLREIEMFLFHVMEKAKMFGSHSSNRGL